mgnify:CR=1 FL=1|jgi:hypothetical protein
MAHLSAHHHAACHRPAILGSGQVKVCAGQGDSDLFGGAKHDHSVLCAILLDKPRDARREADPSQHVVYNRDAVFLRVYRFSHGFYSLNLNIAIAGASI